MTTFQKAIKTTDKPAIIIPGGPTITYNHLNKILFHLHNVFTAKESPLSSSVTEPRKIGIALPNGLEFIASYLAVTTFGYVAAPLNANYKEKEFDFYLDDLKASAIIVPRGAHSNPNLEIIKSAKNNNAAVIEVWFDGTGVQFELFDPSSLNSIYSTTSKKFVNHLPPFGILVGKAKPNDVAMILHTSGTTGRPKAVPLTHRNITTTMTNIVKTYHLSHDDITYIVMPLFHVHGLIGGLLSTFQSQGTAVIPPKFSATNFWGDFFKYDCNWYTAVPTIHMILLSSKHTPPSEEIKGRLRFIRSCSAALAPETFRKMEEYFGCPVVEAYAMTEAAHQMTSNNLPGYGKKVSRKSGTVGVPQGVEVVILNDKDETVPQGHVGEVSIHGINVTKGYLNNPKANKENFSYVESKKKTYFRTGDQGKLDEEGRVVLTGRIKELINRGGEKISPIELDGVLLEHPAVAEAVAFGVDDKKYGQAVNAAIVLKPGSSLTEEEITNFLKDKIAAFKIPVKFFFVDKLPKTATGKIQRRIIAQVFASKSKL
ncbi:hypothetical protein B5S32_g2339 [[Candida] boidinii]|nr:hypothetical protein B5S32_g2339 [[Candida] boidinii]